MISAFVRSLASSFSQDQIGPVIVFLSRSSILCKLMDVDDKLPDVDDFVLFDYDDLAKNETIIPMYATDVIPADHLG